MTKEPLGGIAVIGMAGRFPGAPDVDAFWEMLRDGREGISFFSAAELIESGISPKLVHNPSYVRARGILPDIERFDARFFGYSPREAEILDPQHRFFLEYCWTALEAAGYASDKPVDPIGVFAGSIGSNTYLVNNLLGNQELRENVGDYPMFVANDRDSLTTRAAYKLNLRGPAVTVQSACSTSLVAVAMACQSLIDFQCDLALAGGVSITVPQKIGYLYLPGLVVSPDGHCRAFDAKAQGTLTSSGIGVVVLKRIEDAIRDRDSIVAVIRGWAVNNDGSEKVGFTAPSVQGQADCIVQALAAADVEAETIGMIEAHGTGTPVGDPIEVAGLTQAFRTSTKKRGYCAIGSLKSNVGHLEIASGVAGLIKAAQALQHGQIPPTLHFETPNPEIDFPSSPFYVNTELRPWPKALSPRRAGVSSLGIGGTNAHVVMEEAPPAPQTDPGRPWKLLVLSARSRTALESASTNLQQHLQKHPGLDLADVAYTLQVGRRAFAHRRVVVCSDQADAAEVLRTADPHRVFNGEAPDQAPGVVFMFAGQGSQYVNMCRELYQYDPTFRETLDQCCDYLRGELNLDLRTILFPPEDQQEQAAQQLTQTAITQPALFVIEYALAKMWMKFGLQPVAMIGHSIGEYTAACLAGVMTLRDALSLVAQRGLLMQQMPPGAMLAVPLSEEQVRPLLTPELSLAAINGPSHCVIAGSHAAIDALERRLNEKQQRGRRLQTSHAFHSAMMDPILKAFTEKVRRVRLSPPRIRYISNVTGRWITSQEATDPGYYARQLRGTVRFSPGLEALLSEPDRVLLELGPGATLSILARRHPDPTARRVVLSSLRIADGTQSDLLAVLTTLGRLWLAGCPVQFPALFERERRRRVPLPTYPFERERFWLDPVRKTVDPLPAPKPKPAAQSTAADIDSYFYRPSWNSSTVPQPTANGRKQSWLLFIGDQPLGPAIARRLRQQGHAVTTIRAGDSYAHQHLGELTINPSLIEDYENVVEGLVRQGIPAGATGERALQIMHLWNVGNDTAEPTLEGLREAQALSYFSLTQLARALGLKLPTERLRLTVVTSGAVRVQPEEGLGRPDRALVSGPCRVIPIEYHNIACQHIDVESPAPGSSEEDALAERLINETSAATAEPVIAYRGLQRFTQQYRPMRLPRPAGDLPRLRQGGTYLITGGLGGIGLVLAEYLARSYRAKLLLTSRTGLPEPAGRPGFTEAGGEQRTEQTERRMRLVESLERLGAQVMVVRADVSDLSAMQAAVDAAVARFGPIRGIIHAAGVAGGGVIQRRSKQAAEDVLLPKVTGTLVLDTIFKKRDLDFFILCSSLSAVLGGFGQADYSAGNAFLDAFAYYRSGRSRGLTASVAWDTWREVGMAVDAARQRGSGDGRASQQTVGNMPYRELSHPLFDRFMRSDSGAQIYRTRLHGIRRWVLDEHRVNGRATLPGTAYLELARAAYELHMAQVQPMELRDVALVAPLTVLGDREIDLRTIIQPIGGGPECEFIVSSRQDPARSEWQEHARGRIAPIGPAAIPQHDIERLMRDTPMLYTEGQAGTPPRQIQFGPRWQNLVQVRFGSSQGLAFIRLPEAFQEDLTTFALHPALLDTATGFVSVRAQLPYLPFAYRKVRIYRSIGQSLYSYAAFEETREGGRERMHINLTIMDTSGVVLLEVEDYVLVKVPA
jgi:acyl transferase domain-containing protein